MKEPKQLPPVHVLRKRFRYDPRTGDLIHKLSPAFNKPVRTRQYGFYVTSINGQNFRVHRIIWKMVTGEDPAPFQIRHLNNNGFNNRTSNLAILKPETLGDYMNRWR